MTCRTRMNPYIPPSRVHSAPVNDRRRLAVAVVRPTLCPMAIRAPCSLTPMGYGSSLLQRAATPTGCAGSAPRPGGRAAGQQVAGCPGEAQRGDRDAEYVDGIGFGSWALVPNVITMSWCWLNTMPVGSFV